jgi:hypothetical protein
MLTVAFFAIAMTGMPATTSGQAVSVIARAPAPARPVAEGAPTRRVCRFETATGSNFRQRVCRDVPIQGTQDQQTREFMRSFQRIRLPDEGGGPAGPVG